jgi:hypothetical protein
LRLLSGPWQDFDIVPVLAARERRERLYALGLPPPKEIARQRANEATADISVPQRSAILYPAVLIRLALVHDDDQGICWKLCRFLALIWELQTEAVGKFHRPPVALPEEHVVTEKKVDLRPKKA